MPPTTCASGDRWGAREGETRAKRQLPSLRALRALLESPAFFPGKARPLPLLVAAVLGGPLLGGDAAGRSLLGLHLPVCLLPPLLGGDTAGGRLLGLHLPVRPLAFGGTEGGRSRLRAISRRFRRRWS